MKESVARRIATEQLGAQPDRFGAPLIDHASRVAASVSPDARAVAWLHDVLERTPLDPLDLRAHGLTADELAALELLTRRPSTDGHAYELHVLHIAYADGVPGGLARDVKLADLEDHIAHGLPGVASPPYAWALRHIRAAKTRERTAS